MNARRNDTRRRRGEVAPGSAWALVTGAGSGIGRCYALRLAAAGYDLVLAGDRREPLEAVRREIGTTVRAAAEVRIAEIDLARTGAAEELHAFTEREGIAVDVLINNAGIFSFLDILRTPAERIERIILLHDLTNTQLCRLYAADMARRGRGGHILNMSSYSLWMPFPGLSLYSASKAYLRAFSVAFAKEVRDEGIRVTAVCPAGVATDLYGLTPRWQRIGLRLGVLISADSCARRGLRALWRGRRTIVPDWWNRIWIPLCKLLPMQAIRPLRRVTMRFQRSRGPARGPLRRPYLRPVLRPSGRRPAMSDRLLASPYMRQVFPSTRITTDTRSLPGIAFRMRPRRKNASCAGRIPSALKDRSAGTQNFVSLCRRTRPLRLRKPWKRSKT